MAYRSDVRVVVSKKGYQQLKKYVNDHLPEEYKEYNLLQNTDVECIEDNEVYLGWNDIKWYEYSDFKEVDSIMDGLDFLRDNEYSFCYARIGENADDYDDSYYDGEKDGMLTFPQLERYFYDDYFKDNQNEVDKDVEV
jgi:hypothetical protein